MFPLRSGIAADQQVPDQLQVWWVSDGGNWANDAGIIEEAQFAQDYD